MTNLMDGSENQGNVSNISPNSYGVKPWPEKSGLSQEKGLFI